MRLITQLLPTSTLPRLPGRAAFRLGTIALALSGLQVPAWAVDYI